MVMEDPVGVMTRGFEPFEPEAAPNPWAPRAPAPAVPAPRPPPQPAPRPPFQLKWLEPSRRPRVTRPHTARLGPPAVHVKRPGHQSLRARRLCPAAPAPAPAHAARPRQGAATGPAPGPHTARAPPLASGLGPPCPLPQSNSAASLKTELAPQPGSVRSCAAFTVAHSAATLTSRIAKDKGAAAVAAAAEVQALMPNISNKLYELAGMITEHEEQQEMVDAISESPGAQHPPSLPLLPAVPEAAPPSECVSPPLSPASSGRGSRALAACPLQTPAVGGSAPPQHAGQLAEPRWDALRIPPAPPLDRETLEQRAATAGRAELGIAAEIGAFSCEPGPLPMPSTRASPRAAAPKRHPVLEVVDKALGHALDQLGDLFRNLREKLQGGDIGGSVAAAFDAALLDSPLMRTLRTACAAVSTARETLNGLRDVMTSLENRVNRAESEASAAYARQRKGQGAASSSHRESIALATGQRGSTADALALTGGDGGGAVGVHRRAVVVLRIEPPPGAVLARDVQRSGQLAAAGAVRAAVELAGAELLKDQLASEAASCLVLFSSTVTAVRWALSLQLLAQYFPWTHELLEVDGGVVTVPPGEGKGDSTSGEGIFSGLDDLSSALESAGCDSAAAAAAEVPLDCCMRGMRLNTAVRTGPVWVEASEYGAQPWGSAVATASRLCMQAPLGSVCVAADTGALLRGWAAGAGVISTTLQSGATALYPGLLAARSQVLVDTSRTYDPDWWHPGAFERRRSLRSSFQVLGSSLTMASKHTLGAGGDADSEGKSPSHSHVISPGSSPRRVTMLGSTVLRRSATNIAAAASEHAASPGIGRKGSLFCKSWGEREDSGEITA
eukprot:TRINITY_DN7553_c2_g1_i1.p1 TRINITY_DN7553_c2_g1~~TRINITY_DN7553_c2_g1_i1.p1  ORF type:complete len:880 (+),score=151.26 TRINITY_DN7553_c2_g1_i1:110-2641(+)